MQRVEAIKIACTCSINARVGVAAAAAAEAIGCMHKQFSWQLSHNCHTKRLYRKPAAIYGNAWGNVENALLEMHFICTPFDPCCLPSALTCN